MNWLNEVWNPASVLAAAVGGLVIGYALAWVLPADPNSGRARAALLGFLILAVIGVAFYAGQALATLLVGLSDATPRVTSRFTLWILFVATMVIGSYVARGRQRP